VRPTRLSGCTGWGLSTRQLIFGAYSVVTELALQEDVDPAVFSFLRDVFASPLLLLGAWYFEGLPRIQPEHQITFILLGLSGIFGNQLFYILGLNYTSPLNAALLQVRHARWAGSGRPAARLGS